MKELETTDTPDKIELELLTFKREKKEQDFTDDNAPVFEKFLAFLGERVGVIAKEHETFVIKEWAKFLKKQDYQMTTVDVAGGLSCVLAQKDADEVTALRMASKISCNAMDRYAAEKILDIVDSDAIKTTHEKLAAQIDASLEARKIKIPAEAEAGGVEWAYPPSVQSGGKYDLRPAGFSNQETIHPSVIVCSLGIRYRSYCSNVARTYMIDPDKPRQNNYRLLLNLENYLIAQMRPGETLFHIYEKGVSFVKETNPDLVQYLTKSFGYSIGLEFKDNTFSVAPKCDRKIEAGMTFLLQVGFAGIPSEKHKDERGKVYSLYLSDIVSVTHEGTQLLTEASKRGEKEISYFFEDEKVKKENKKPNENVPKSTILPHRTRQEKKVESEVSNVARRQAHQKMLSEKLHADGLKRFTSGGITKLGTEEKQVRRFESYKRWDQLPPPQSSRVQIVVDNRNETVVLPMYGAPVPFHVNTIKNISKQDESDWTYLRFNFVSPGQAGVRKADAPIQAEDATATYIRGVSYRSQDQQHFGNLFKDINELKKRVAKQELERAQMADLVEQARLEMMRGRKPYRLGDVYIRPQPEGKRFSGDLEIHQNGIRYVNPVRSEQQVDVLFSNIRHLFFQPCDNELFVIIHCNLKNPIMIGKKKTRDVQFYREVSDAGFDETGNRKRRHNYGDEDEIMAEQEERKRRLQMNRDFQDFAQKIREQAKSNGSNLDVDIPLRELSFKGVTHRELVNLMPTQNCLVQLSENPWTVVDLSDVEKVHLERVQFGNKNFDAVFVPKDFTKPTVHVTIIPTADLELIKDWLDQMDVQFSEGPITLNWSAIMKTIQENPGKFFQEDGWYFLEEKAPDDSEEESEESEYDESVSESDASSSEEDSESAVEESDSASGSEDESGEDWDDLEADARKCTFC